MSQFRKRNLFGLLLLVALIAAASCSTESGENYGPPLLLLYAFGPEGEALAEVLNVDSTSTILGRSAIFGKLADSEIVLAPSGVGMTNAAMMTQEYISRFRPFAVVFTGIAGAIDADVNIGDVIVCQRWATHDRLNVRDDTTSVEAVRTFIAKSDSIEAVKYFHVDSTLYQVATVLDDASIPFESINGRAPALRFGGTGVSGNAFVDSKRMRAWLSEQLDAVVTDMESAAVAQVCAANGTPVLIVRSASDLAGGGDEGSARQQLKAFFRVAADNSAAFVMRFVRLVEENLQI